MGQPARVQRVVIDYVPRRVFQPYHDRTQRWAALVAHRRCGKTVACINDTIKRAVTCSREHGRYAYVAPYLSQAKEVAWEYVKRYARPILRDKNESELWVELINGARIRIHGADNPDRLRGAYLDGVVLDEYADMRPSVWGEVIRPMLADRLGWATFVGTPKGRNSFHTMATRAQADPEWYSTMLRASETGILSASELASARAEMTPEQYEQEFECSFEAAITGAYYGKEIAQAERDGRVMLFDHEPTADVHVAWDLGVGDPMALWFYQTIGNELHIIDHYENTGYAIPHYAEVKKRKAAEFGYVYGDDWVPQDAKQRSMGNWDENHKAKQRIEVMFECGLKPRLVAPHKVEDGINALRVLFTRIWINKDRCADGLEALRQYRTEYDEKTKTFKNEPKHDWTSHSADAARYIAMAYKQQAPAARAPSPIGHTPAGIAILPPKHVKVLTEMSFDEYHRALGISRGGKKKRRV